MSTNDYGSVRLEQIDPFPIWRYSMLAECPTHETLCLQGGYRGCLHASLTPEAVCLHGVSTGQAFCLSEPPEPKEPAHHDDLAPADGCSCGFYGTYLPNLNRWPVSSEGPMVAVCAQAVGVTLLGEYGLRARQLRLLGLFLSPRALQGSGDVRKRFWSVATGLGLEDASAEPGHEPNVLARLGLDLRADQLWTRGG